MRLTETRRDFVSLQDRCRVVIVKTIKKRDELDALKLPIRITKYLAQAVNDPSMTPLTPVDNFDIYKVQEVVDYLYIDNLYFKGRKQFKFYFV